MLQSHKKSYGLGKQLGNTPGGLLLREIIKQHQKPYKFIGFSIIMFNSHMLPMVFELDVRKPYKFIWFSIIMFKNHVFVQLFLSIMVENLMNLHVFGVA